MPYCILFHLILCVKKKKIQSAIETVSFDLQGCDYFTEDGVPKTPFPNGWKGENGLYAVGFTRRGLLGTASDAVKIARDVAEQWRTINHAYKGPQDKL